MINQKYVQQYKYSSAPSFKCFCKGYSGLAGDITQFSMADIDIQKEFIAFIDKLNINNEFDKYQLALVVNSIDERGSNDS